MGLEAKVRAINATDWQPLTPGVVLPHVILLPGASPRMLPVARPEGCEATYGPAPSSWRGDYAT